MSRERLARIVLTASFLFTVLIVLPRRPVHHVDLSVYTISFLAWLRGEDPYHFAVASPFVSWGAFLLWATFIIYLFQDFRRKPVDRL